MFMRVLHREVVELSRRCLLGSGLETLRLIFLLV
jgi:hypothetical protein